jgi:HEAT repeat protein
MNCEHDLSRVAQTRHFWEATIMSSPTIVAAGFVAFLLCLHGSVRAQEGKNSQPKGANSAVSQQAARHALAKYERQRQQSNTKSSEKQNWKVWMECLVKLVKTGPASVPVLIECLKSDKAPPYTRAFAAQALGLLADARARPALLQAIEDKDGYVAAHSRIALGRLGRLQATPKLRELAGTDPFRGVHVELTFALTRDDEPNPEPIRKALRNYDLSRMDSAKLGKPAPDFTLGDASGKTWRLEQFRGKESVVLIFLGVHA